MTESSPLGKMVLVGAVRPLSYNGVIKFDESLLRGMKMMLGFVLGTDGSLSTFFEAFKQTGDQLTTAEYDLLKELVHLARHPGIVVNLAQKLALTTAELDAQMTHLQDLGLIAYWSGTADHQSSMPVLLVR